MDDQSDCVIVAEVPADPECKVIRASRPTLVNPEVKSESVSLEKTPEAKLDNLPHPVKLLSPPPLLRERRGRK